MELDRILAMTSAVAKRRLLQMSSAAQVNLLQVSPVNLDSLVAVETFTQVAGRCILTGVFLRKEDMLQEGASMLLLNVDSAVVGSISSITVGGKTWKPDGKIVINPLGIQLDVVRQL